MVVLRRPALAAFCLLLVMLIAACGTTPPANTGNAGMANKNDNNMTNGNANKMMGTATPTVAGNNMNGNGMDNGNNGNYGNNNGDNMGGNNGGNGNGNNNGNDNNNGNMNGNQGNANLPIRTTQVTLNGKKVTVLTDAKGFLLYYRRSDPIPNSACTGDCAREWPPVTVKDPKMPVTSATPLPKKLTVYKTANGYQLEYDGHPLYLYTGDKMPGQFTGRGMDNVWYLVGIQL